MKQHIIIYSILIVIFSFCKSTSVNAQNFTVTGTVINAENGAAVEFANIGVESTYLGTATDINGNFEIILSQALINKKISVSAVGYKPKTYAVAEWENKDGLIIQLAPVNYGLSEINVAAKSKIGYGIIRTASNLIKDNYQNTPYTYKCYMRTKVNSFQDEVLFEMTDSKGYGERSFTESFQNINYRIQKSNPHKEVKLLKEGLTFIDVLISQDLVRNPGNILSVESINNFDVKVEGEDVLGTDSAWVISYICKTPTIQNSGDPQLIDFKGKIWIAYHNNEVLRNSIEAVRKGTFRHGNNFYNDAKNKAEVKYKVETTYRKNENKYVLNTINYIQEETNSRKTSVFLKVVDIENFNSNVKGRQYFNGEAKNSNFWNKYKRPK